MLILLKLNEITMELMFSVFTHFIMRKSNKTSTSFNFEQICALSNLRLLGVYSNYISAIQWALNVACIM